ncbi:UvrD-helicase domain-containing protein [Methanococcus maripaludis]|uniref:DNA helicase-2/ATP-dependent DNA helicase PcrA n=2 Tax=Methanococcus maripaludis TaxID=39152 RepID=A0A7J9PES7_METMI|nr:UvrD-helicase domain-containing protein [Methanococcus maripaludis]MBA2861762.1 DNA helicase-2/ATP-dependent DNA helicase PcrA [Methanococcus maripaludis]
MVEKLLEPEIVEIFGHVLRGNNFLLSGGAGSGKTYSLIQVIRKALNDNPNASIACITYTNSAVNEIKLKINHDNLMVSTIHDFLWNNIKQFQKELKNGIIELSELETSKIKFKNENDKSHFVENVSNIQYKEYIQMKNGIISHDEVLVLAHHLFEKHDLLCNILKDKFKFIFLDEYQDTNKLVIEILLKHLKKCNKEQIIGFFGDSMQSIYDDGIGDLKDYVNSGEVKEVVLNQNRRNPKLVIDLANKLRTDNVIQEPSNDINAPNMKDGSVIIGKINFLYSTTNDVENIKSTQYFSNWNFNDTIKTKELSLTHNLIAPKAGFSNLMAIYDKDPMFRLKNDILSKSNEKCIELDDSKSFEKIIEEVDSLFRNSKKQMINSSNEVKELYDHLKNLPFSEIKKIYFDKDSLIDNKKETDDEGSNDSKRDNLIKHLFKIEKIIQNYKNKDYNEFIRKTNFKIDSIAKKRELKNIIDKIGNFSELKIEEVINLCDEKELCKKDDSFNTFIEKNQYLYNRVKALQYLEFQNLFNYLEGFTPFSTQHKVKGSEFENVLVILDNGGWNNYNFEYLFCNRIDKQSVLLRTQKIFYVCCTRAKENLNIYYHNPNSQTISKAIEWFGEENVHNLDDN